MASSGSYSADSLQVLEGLEAVRKRPGMYIGSTDSRGLMHCLWEIIDNSVDEALAGYCDTITVTLYNDDSVEVADNGRGIPVDNEKKTGLSGVEVVFTKLHAGGKFGGDGYSVSGGLHGVGASVVNALSSRLDVHVYRDNSRYSLSFQRGEPGIFENVEQGANAPFKSLPENKALIKTSSDKKETGTIVRYWADRQIFSPSAQFSYDELAQRAQQTSFLVPGLKITIIDKRSETKDKDTEGQERKEVFKHEGGISEFVDFLSPDSPITDTWRLTGSGKFKETVPVINSDGNSTLEEMERECGVDIALRWGTGYETTIRSFVNIIATSKGGTHVAGFESGIFKTLKKNIEHNARRLKLGNDKLEKDDVLAGLTAVVTVTLSEPQFEGQTKEILGTSAVRSIVSRISDKDLNDILTTKNRQIKPQVDILLEKIVSEMKSRISARAHKETQRRKNALESSTLPTKLADCRSHGVDDSELFIVEGDSALGTARSARDSHYQALLPIRGKILNVQKASLAEMLANSECASLIQVIGGGSGRSFDLDSVRYGKIILMTDADVDGAHIRTLLLTLFFRYMKPLVEAGKVYAAVPPLHRIEVINKGSKTNETIYTYSEAELHATLKQLELEGRHYKEPIQRYKGLGEMDEDQLAETTMDPEFRTLRRVTIDDISKAEEVFQLLMGSDVAPRKEFIIEGAQYLDFEKIDI